MIEVTPAQAQALVELTAREGTVWLHQLAHIEAPDEDLYVTPHGSRRGFRISRDGATSEMGETLPSPD